MKKLGKRAERAMAVLEAGGCFRQGMRRNSYTGFTKNECWLEDAERCAVPGIGGATFRELEPMLVRDWTMHPGSSWEQAMYLPARCPQGRRYYEV